MSFMLVVSQMAMVSYIEQQLDCALDNLHDELSQDL